MTEVKRFAVGDLLTESTGHPYTMPENVGPTRVVRISEDRQTIWLECINFSQPFSCKLFTQGDMEIATYGDADRGWLYLEYCSESIETEYTEYGVGAD